MQIEVIFWNVPFSVVLASLFRKLRFFENIDCRNYFNLNLKNYILKRAKTHLSTSNFKLFAVSNDGKATNNKLNVGITRIDRTHAKISVSDSISFSLIFYSIAKRRILRLNHTCAPTYEYTYIFT